MILIKELYTYPDNVYGIIEMQDGTLYRFLKTPFRQLTEKNLTLINSPLPNEQYIQATHAIPYETFVDNVMNNYGLTKSPLKYYRSEKGLTQKQLADATGINIRQIQKYESGEYSVENMTLKNAQLIADTLGINVSQLLCKEV